MKEPAPNPDRQDNLLRPLAREPDPRERALLEENLAAVRELRDLLREPATDPEDKILPALRLLESRLDALPDSLLGRIRQAVDDCLTAASQETRATKPSGDLSVEEEIAGNRIETAIYLVERNLLKSLDSHGESTYLLFEEAGKRDKEITDQIGKIHPALRSINNQVSRLNTSISVNQLAVALQFVPVLGADCGCCRDGDRIHNPSDPAIAEFAMRRMSASARPAVRSGIPGPREERHAWSPR